MVYQATNKIADAFAAKGLKYQIKEYSKASEVNINYPCKNLSNVTVHFISRDDDNDVSVRIYGLVRVPENKIDSMLRAMNQAKRGYRYVALVIDNENDLNICYDFPLRTTNVGDVAVETLIRMADIADNIYPDLMRAMWG